VPQGIPPYDFLEDAAAELAAPLLAHLMPPNPAPDLLPFLQSALGHRYRLERELAGGGMSRVFIGEELGLSRRVVLKALPPEMTLATSAERFRREIQLAASLQHPHIVPLLSAGEAEGSAGSGTGQVEAVLYYTMPFVEGESLHRRLERSGRLSLPEAVRIGREITAALGYAHRHGVVHRDIKPGNILLTEDGALVLDFGVAKALSAPSGDPAVLTSVGLVLGTPAYMAPEQAAADPQVDHRADLYALGCVIYEMVSGRPPFAPSSRQAMLAAHAAETPTAVSSLRPDLPPALASLIMSLLAKHPANRPQSASLVLGVLDGIATQATPTVIPHVLRSPTHQRLWWPAAGIAALVGTGVLVGHLARAGTPARLDRQLVAIAPFRVSSVDTSLAYLREGMVDLLATKLNGTAALRSADPRTLLGAAQRPGDLVLPSREEASALARSAGAGRMIQGEVVGTGASLTISASLIDVASGKMQAQTSVEGAPDSVTRLVDGLAARLLSLGAGESSDRLATLTSTSLPALRAYLDGQSLLRRGLFERAAEQFDRALAFDSTFALAGLGSQRAAEWFFVGDPTQGGQPAWRHRERLSARDKAQLAVMLGPRFPGRSDRRDILEAAERFARLAPDSPESWYALGDRLFHDGPLLGIADALPRADAAFGRALAIDSGFAPALIHKPVLAFELGDTAGLRKAVSRFLAIDSTSPRAAQCRWYLPAALGDSAGMRVAFRDDSLPARVHAISHIALAQGVGMSQVTGLLERARRAALTAEERAMVDWDMYAHLNHLGRALQASSMLPSLEGAGRHLLPASVGLFGDGDSAAMLESIAVLERAVGSALATTDEETVNNRYLVGQYAFARGRTREVRGVIADLRRAHVPRDTSTSSPEAYAVILEAQLAARHGSSDAGRLLAALDSILMRGPYLPSVAGNLVAARLHEQRGELAAALAAVRRRAFDIVDFPEYVTYLREEGRLAALTGDRVGAARAYHRYLAIRIDPEPQLRAQVAQVRADLAAVEQGGEGGSVTRRP
jgi:tetratricopeptide (TPR) repeat protein